jgi:hypothetical protein
MLGLEPGAARLRILGAVLFHQGNPFFERAASFGFELGDPFLDHGDTGMNVVERSGFCFCGRCRHEDLQVSGRRIERECSKSVRPEEDARGVRGRRIFMARRCCHDPFAARRLKCADALVGITRHRKAKFENRKSKFADTKSDDNMRTLRKMASTCVGGPPRTAVPTKTRKDKTQRRETEALERKSPPFPKRRDGWATLKIICVAVARRTQDPHAKAGQGLR